MVRSPYDPYTPLNCYGQSVIGAYNSQKSAEAADAELMIQIGRLRPFEELAVEAFKDNETALAVISRQNPERRFNVIYDPPACV